jgi:hypothetical protein
VIATVFVVDAIPLSTTSNKYVPIRMPIRMPILAWMRRSLPSVARTQPAARPAAKISTVVLIALTISTEVNIVRVAAEGPCSAQIPVRPKS